MPIFQSIPQTWQQLYHLYGRYNKMYSATPHSEPLMLHTDTASILYTV